MKFNTLKCSIVLLCLICSGAFAWNIDGRVVSDDGTSIEGAIVSSIFESENYVDTTDVNGNFSIQQNTIAIKMNSKKTSFSIHIQDNMLFLNGINGIASLSFLDALGKVYFETHIFSSGESQILLPKAFKSMNSYLLVKNESANLSRTTLYKAAGNRISALAIEDFPVFKFTKSGFADTTYTMLSFFESNVKIVMRDTTKVVTDCPAQILSPGDYSKTISVNGVNRNYIIHVPSAYKGNSAVPLLVDFHPIGGSAQNQMNASPYKNITDSEGVITVYPDGMNSPNSGQAWNVEGCCTTADDTSFVRAFVKEVESLTCIDTKRVYATGFSMGGGMSHYSACHLADIFAAVAPAAFDLVNENQASCLPSRPIPVLSFRSTGDIVVSYAGAYSSFVTGMPITFLGAKATFEKWASLNGCTDSASPEDANGCSFYSDCKDGVVVGLCTKQGGSHEYGNANIGWPWLKQFTLP